MRPEDIAKIARDSGWKNEDFMEAIYYLSKEIARPSGNTTKTCFICGGDGFYLGEKCSNCGTAP